jgi:hypothetical protein
MDEHIRLELTSQLHKNHRGGRTYPIEVTMDDTIGVNCEEY